MSEIFHKSCYTSRSPGYKYRTLSTNTGERKKRDSGEDFTFEKKFKELRKAILIRVNKEVNETRKARESIFNKFHKVDAKINSMLELQDTVNALWKDLHTAGYTLVEMVEKVDKIDFNTQSELFSLRTDRNSFRSQAPITEEVEENDSIVTHI